MSVPKLITVGIDGGCFDLIIPWLENNELPNIKYMVEHGVSGGLFSCLPPVTCPNWKCYSTGLNPGKLGLFWWENIDIKNRKALPPPVNKNRADNFWDLLNDNGYRSAIINTPLTYPPKPINGYMIAGGPDALEDNYCYPADLENELRSKFGYIVNSDNHDLGQNNGLDQKMLDLIDMRFKVADYLMEKDELDFVQVTTFYINVLQHFYWNADSVKEGWKIIDRWIGRFLDKGTNIWIMSDHGCMSVDVDFFINSWLQEEGYLTLRDTINKRLKLFGINRENLKSMIDFFRLRGFLKKMIPPWWKHFIPTREGLFVGRGMMHAVDWDRSVAVGLGQGPLYVWTDEGEEKYSKLLTEISEKLIQLRVPGSDRKVVKDIKIADEIYHGTKMEHSPSLVLDYAKGIHIAASVGRNTVFAEPLRWQADNKEEGIFVGFGPDMKERYKTDKLSILDLAPTLLHLYGVPMTDNMDGKVHREFFKNTSESSNREVKISSVKDRGSNNGDSENEEVQIAKRLKQLGYME